MRAMQDGIRMDCQWDKNGFSCYAVQNNGENSGVYG